MKYTEHQRKILKLLKAGAGVVFQELSMAEEKWRTDRVYQYLSADGITRLRCGRHVHRGGRVSRSGFGMCGRWGG